MTADELVKYMEKNPGKNAEVEKYLDTTSQAFRVSFVAAVEEYESKLAKK